jgi:hypothetical protein
MENDADKNLIIAQRELITILTEDRTEKKMIIETMQKIIDLQAVQIENLNAIIQIKEMQVSQSAN